MELLKKIGLLAFISVLFVTCKKEELPQSTTVGQPVFSFNGNINGNAISWQAGVNNYYMYSSYSQNSNGVYSFAGNLQNTATANNSIEISINDSKASASNVSLSIQHIDSSFSQSLYSYNTGGTLDTTYSITFTPVIYAGSPLSYSYNFGDGGISTVKSPTHIYTATGTYTTTLTAYFSTGNVTISNPITIYKTQPQLWIDSIYSTDDTSGNFPVTFTTAISNGREPYTYNWSFGDGGTSSSISSNTTCSTTHYYDSAKTYISKLTVTDKSYHSETYYYPVWPDFHTNNPYGMLDYKMTPPIQDTVRNSLSLSDVTINYTDGSGISYTSKNSLQPKNSSFHINSISPYQNNLNNNPTIQLNVTFNCMLYNGTQSIAASGTAVIAVAYH